MPSSSCAFCGLKPSFFSLQAAGHPARRHRVKYCHDQLLRDRITTRGPLEKEDFEQLAKEIDPFIAANGKLVGVMIHTESFPGWESFGALVSHFKFVADHHRQLLR
jgi:hypothetical protein